MKKAEAKIEESSKGLCYLRSSSVSKVLRHIKILILISVKIICHYSRRTQSTRYFLLILTHVSPPEKHQIFLVRYHFQINQGHLNQLLQAANTLDLLILLSLVMVSFVLPFAIRRTTPQMTLIIGETDKQFSFNFKVENIKILLELQSPSLASVSQSLPILLSH